MFRNTVESGVLRAGHAGCRLRTTVLHPPATADRVERLMALRASIACSRIGVAS